MLRAFKRSLLRQVNITPEPRAEFFRQIDAVNVDLKGFSDEFYRKRCLSRLTPVLETLEYLHSQDQRLAGSHVPADPRENYQDEQLHRPGSGSSNISGESRWLFTAFIRFQMVESGNAVRTLEGPPYWS